jgi:hypothetical protein
MKGKRTIIAAAIMAAMATFIVILMQNNSRLHQENVALHDQLAGMDKSGAENKQFSKPATNATESLPQDQMNELLRLRGQMGSLKRQLAEAAKSGARSPSSATSPAVDSLDPEKHTALIKQQSMAKASYATTWMSAFIQYAEDHEGRFPTSFDQAAEFLGDKSLTQTQLALLATNQFEIVYQGSRRDATVPGNTIMLRETQATQLPDGTWVKIYGQVDGAGQAIKMPDGNFGPWESEHLQKPPGK